MSALAKDQNVEFQLARALELNALSLENIAALKGLRENEGWQIVEGQIRKDIENKTRLITDLAIDPDKNRNQLIINASIREMLRRIISLVDQTLDMEHHVRAERDALLND